MATKTDASRNKAKSERPGAASAKAVKVARLRPEKLSRAEQDRLLLAKYGYNHELTTAEKIRLTKIQPDFRIAIAADGQLNLISLARLDEITARLQQSPEQKRELDEFRAMLETPEGKRAISELSTQRAKAIATKESVSLETQPESVDNAPTPDLAGMEDEGLVQKPQQKLLEKIKDRPDLALACLKFLEKEVTRPEYAKLSTELTEARLEKERKKEREKKARYRQRVRAAVPAGPR